MSGQSAERIERPTEMNEHNVRWMFHSTAMVMDYDLACSSLGRLCGLATLEYSELLHPNLARRGGMTWIGDNSLEVDEPIVKGSPAERFVTKTGGGMHSVALQVTDIDATISHLERLGIEVTRPADNFCFSDPRQTGRVLFEWCDAAGPHDPRFGFPMPERTGDALVDVRRQAFVGAVVDNPSRVAAQIARVVGTEVLFEDPGADTAHPVAGISLGDNILALYRLPQQQSIALWGVDLSQPRTHVLGLEVSSLEDAAAALAEGGFRVLWADGGSIVVDPVSTGGIGIVLVDRLLPGDPRG